MKIRNLIRLAGVLLTVVSANAGAAKTEALPSEAWPAAVSALGPRCGVRDSDWGDWLLQSAAGDVQVGQPMVGTGMFAYAEDGYFNRSLGEVELAALGGVQFYERYGQAACTLLDDSALGWADAAVDVLRKGPMHRLLPASGILDGTPPALIGAAWLQEAVVLASRCRVRDAAWVRDADQGVEIAVDEAAEEGMTVKGAQLTDRLHIAAGARVMATYLATAELNTLRKQACEWVKRPDALSRLDGLVREWRDVVRKAKAGNLSGLGGIP